MKIMRIISVAVLLLALTPVSTQAASAITWDSSTVLKGQVTIASNQSVVVAPNTKIVVQNGTQIIINGTLTAPAGLSLTGKSWAGIVVAGTAVITNFLESGASTSFRVTPTGSLTINKGTISGILGASEVEGTFVADSLHYDKGAGGGINSSTGTGSITIDRSVLTGAGKNTGDFFGLYGAKSISLTNSQMSGAHCAFHVLGVENMKLDHDTIAGNAYGFMMYGSSTIGTKTISNTTIKNNSVGFDEGSSSTHNGSILISHSAIIKNGQNLGLYTGKVKVVSPLTK
jgi:hypothetical protein